MDKRTLMIALVVYLIISFVPSLSLMSLLGKAVTSVTEALTGTLGQGLSVVGG